MCTPNRETWIFLSFALWCIVLIDPLLELAERDGEKRRKPRKPWIGVAPADEKGQFLMFPMPIEKRMEYDKLARTLGHFLPENVKAGSTFEHDWNLEFVQYEFYAFFKRYESKLPPMIEQLKKIAAGETLDDYKPLIEFLGALNGSALHEHESHRKGCF